MGQAEVLKVINRYTGWLSSNEIALRLNGESINTLSAVLKKLRHHRMVQFKNKLKNKGFLYRRLDKDEI